VRTTAVAVLLVILGGVCWAGFRALSGSENHAYSPGSVPPHTVRVTAGHTYELAYPGGVAALAGQGVDPASLQCQWSQRGSSTRQALAVDGADPTTVERNAVGQFLAPVSGAIHIACDSLGTMFVDDADDSHADSAGWLLAAATIALTIGVPLALSALRGRRLPPRPSSEDDEIERFVQALHASASDDEVARRDTGDVGA
jgi:hypothetical protein